MARITQREYQKSVNTYSELFSLTTLSDGMTIRVIDSNGDPKSNGGLAYYKFVADKTGADKFIIDAQENEEHVIVEQETLLITNGKVTLTAMPTNGIIIEGRIYWQDAGIEYVEDVKYSLEGLEVNIGEEYNDKYFIAKYFTNNTGKVVTTLNVDGTLHTHSNRLFLDTLEGLKTINGEDIRGYGNIIITGGNGVGGVSSFNDLSDKPITVEGYGITNVFNKNDILNLTKNYTTAEQFNILSSEVDQKITEFNSLQSTIDTKIVEFTTAKDTINNILDNNTILLSTVATIGQEIAAGNNTEDTILQSLATKADKSDSLAGYGILDSYTKSESDNLYYKKTDNIDTRAASTLPTLTFSPYIIEGTSCDIVINNYSLSNLYTISANIGTVLVVDDTITFTSDAVLSDTFARVIVEVEEPGKAPSHTTADILVKKIAFTEDSLLTYEGNNINQFTTLINSTLSGNEISVSSEVPLTVTDNTIMNNGYMEVGDLINIDDNVHLITEMSSDNSYISSTSPTIPTIVNTAHLLSGRALSVVITQDTGQNDFAAMYDIIGKYHTQNIIAVDTTKNKLTSYLPINNGDKISITDGIISKDIIASNVQVNKLYTNDSQNFNRCDGALSPDAYSSISFTAGDNLQSMMTNIFQDDLYTYIITPNTTTGSAKKLSIKIPKGGDMSIAANWATGGTPPMAGGLATIFRAGNYVYSLGGCNYVTATGSGGTAWVTGYSYVSPSYTGTHPGHYCYRALYGSDLTVAANWTKSTSLISVKNSCSLPIVDGDYVYLIGGAVSSGVITSATTVGLNRVFKANINSDLLLPASWTETTWLNTYKGGRLYSDVRYFYLIGGIYAGSATKNIFRAPIGSDLAIAANWTAFSALPSAVANAGVYIDSLYVNVVYGTSLYRCKKSDDITNSLNWSTVLNFLPVSMTDMQVICDSKNAYLFGPTHTYKVSLATMSSMNIDNPKSYYSVDISAEGFGRSPMIATKIPENLSFKIGSNSFITPKYIDSTYKYDINGITNSNTISIVPVMTSANTPRGIVSDSGMYSTSVASYMMFDGNDSTAGQFSADIGVVLYQDTAFTIVNKYSIMCGSTELGNTSAPKSWILSASMDGTNYEVLDTVIEQVNWYNGETRYYNFSNSRLYKYYKIQVTSNNGHMYCAIKNIGFYNTFNPDSVELTTNYTPIISTTTGNTVQTKVRTVPNTSTIKVQSSLHTLV